MDLFDQLVNPPPFVPIKLHDYQEQAVAELFKGWYGNRLGNVHRSQLVVLHTGAGKSVLFGECTRRFLEQGKRVLILAHRFELLEQAEHEIKLVTGPDVKFGLEQGSNRAELTDQVVVGSVQSLHSERISRFPRDHFDLVVVDEAHHAIAASYQAILGYFENAFKLGVTATPKRSDKESLRKVFTRVAYKRDIVDGTRLGSVAPIVTHRVSSVTDLANVKVTAGDFNLKALEATVNNADRNSLIVKTYQERFQGRQFIVFATGVEHAQAITADFANIGVRAEAITGDMDKELRARFLGEFKNLELQGLTNYGVLTEGYNHRPLDLIFMARPTKSMLLLTQIVGRGTRVMPGKPHCDVVEIIDQHSDDTATVAKMYGFAQDFDCEGSDFKTLMERADEMERLKEFFDPWCWKSRSEMEARFGRATEADPRGTGQLPRRGFEQTQKTTWFDSRYRYHVGVGGDTYRARVRDSGSDQVLVLELRPTALGTYEGNILERVPSGTMKKLYRYEGDTLRQAAQRLEQGFQENWQRLDGLLNINAAWRIRAAQEPCTEKQYGLMRKFRIDRGRPMTAWTKKDAMDAIEEFFRRKG